MEGLLKIKPEKAEELFQALSSNPTFKTELLESGLFAKIRKTNLTKDNRGDLVALFLDPDHGNDILQKFKNNFEFVDIYTKAKTYIDEFGDIAKVKALFDDLAADESGHLINAMRGNPKLVGAYKDLFYFPQFRTRIDILEHYPKVKRIGSYGPDVQPFEVSKLVRTHPVPRPGNENTIPELTAIYSTTGYNLTPDNAISAITLPDGSNLIINGNHRLQTMVNLDQKIVPVNLFTLEQGNGAFGATNVAMFAEVSRLSGFYNGPPVPHSDPDYIVALAINWLDGNFPGWN